MNTTVQAAPHAPVANPINPYFLFIVGVIFCCVPVAVIFIDSEKYAEAQLVFSIFLALGAAMLAVGFTGVLNVNLPSVKAGGSLGVMVVVLWFANPNAEQELPEESHPEPVVSAQEAPKTPDRARVTAEPAAVALNAVDTVAAASRQAAGTGAVADPGSDTLQAAAAQRESGWIYLGHKSTLRGWTTKHFEEEMPEPGDTVTVTSQSRPLMSQSPKLTGLHYDFGRELYRVEKGAKLEVEAVKVVGLGKVWAKVKPL